ncbi:enterotoxin [Paracidobacterium acidisoli]|uniref:Enterotoxin n=1 Tax=Paracidobacterium acidisoli TaxID=2303751 RepID=A0A372IW64_9BACT|nr:enterotoxin [Paracidobacterium acidisoli]MBT9330109.1 enterotoxin [Paracidobacterium acidisoli]
MSAALRTSERHLLRVAAAALLSTALCFGQAPAKTTVANKALAAHLAASQGRPELVIDNLAAHRTVEIPRLFTVTLHDGSVLQPSGLTWTHPFAAESPDGADEKVVCADLHDPKSEADFHWCLLARPESNYLRERLTIHAPAHDLAITEVRLLDFHDADAHVAGSVKGSPVADDRMFFGFEHPLSWSRVEDGHVEAGITRVLPLQANQSVTYSAVIGTAQPGQMRRAFLAYIESERPRPYKPFLHYNSWYDIGFENRYSEADALDRIHAFGRELVEKRHVELDSFLFDDGWDNPNSFWGFNPGFPDGFTNVAKAAEEIHAGVGVWFSPWGGYEEQKRERVAFGRSHGYEIIKDGFALSGPKYYRDFSKACLEMVDRYNVNQFKFDGTGNADRVFPGSAFDSDFDAAIHLIHRIREEKKGIFINLTTGTYPSPFWLFYADSIWRSGEDHSFDGVGTPRQRWMTYRDEQTYRNIVQRGPLFPLNSLMLHGLIYAKQAKDLGTDPGHDFADEVESYFGSGTQLQEMYITPSLLSDADWNELAFAAKWSRSHSAILKDTHWIGGDPGRLQAYGWAAWAPSGWIITVRNPSNAAQDFSLNLRSALELPAGAASSFTVSEPFQAQGGSAAHWQAEKTVVLHLKPFEVRTFESEPSTARP